MTSLAKQTTKSWSSTLRLPRSSFPARASAGDLALYNRKCTDELYQWQMHSRPTAKVFLLHDGPPYANGDLHVGHALNKIVKDVVCRTKLTDGYRVDYRPGWDCHGLPIEIKALEKLGWGQEKKHDALAVRKAARAFAEETVHRQMEVLKSWAVMGDWANHWTTMDRDFELRQLSVFRIMVQKGLIYRKHKPVYWSPSSRTALAEAELEYNDNHISTSALVKFPLHGELRTRQTEDVYAAVWTTTPWTLPANQAIALNRNVIYCLARSQVHGLLVVARSRLPYVENLIGESLQIVNSHLPSELLLASTYQNPPIFDPSPVPRHFVHAEFVIEDSGTGLVHCAPGHGMEDYDALQSLITSGDITVKAPVDDTGHFTSHAAPGDPQYLAGLDAFREGTERVLQALDRRGMLMSSNEYMHKYPYDWRTKQPIMVRATAQWFADISSVKFDALQALQNVRFLPSTGLARLSSFVQNRNEWCISRQRAWGVPIPALFNRNTGEAVLSDQSITHIMKVIEKRGIDAWWSDSPDEVAWMPDGVSPTDHTRGHDTMDVWFDSGTSWTEMMRSSPVAMPSADVYIEGTDQHRGWFQSSLLTRIACQTAASRGGEPMAPFRSLFTHGFTLDGEGKKMSKSVGNVISPESIISGTPVKVDPKIQNKSGGEKLRGSLGADALRLWVVGSDWTKDVIVSDTVIKTVHSALHKYRVTFKLLLGVLQDCDLSRPADLTTVNLADRLALFQLQQAVAAVQAAFRDFEFHKVVAIINRWINIDFSGFYMESVKDTLYCDSEYNGRRRNAQVVLYHMLCELQAMLGPLTPILIEETWAHTPAAIKKNTSHPLRREWQQVALPEKVRTLAQSQLPLVTAINAAVKLAQEKARIGKKMGSSLESDVILQLKPGFQLIDFEIQEEEMEEILVVSRVSTSVSNSGSPSEILNGYSAEQTWSYTEDVQLPGKGIVGVVQIRKARGCKCVRCWKYTVEQSEKVDLPSQLPDSIAISASDQVRCTRCRTVTDNLEIGPVGE